MSSALPASIRRKKVKKSICQYSSSWEPHLRATGRHLPYGITVLPATRHKWMRPAYNPSHAGRYSIYLPRRDGRLSWPSWLDSAPAESRTSDLSITSRTPNHCTTKTTKLGNQMKRNRNDGMSRRVAKNFYFVCFSFRATTNGVISVKKRIIMELWSDPSFTVKTCRLCSLCCLLTFRCWEILCRTLYVRGR